MMEVRDWITILSVVALIVGWFTNSWLNRRNEIAKERLKYRMDTLSSIVDLLSEIQESIDNKKGDITHLTGKISKISYAFDIYGKEDEQKYWKLFIKAINERGKTEQPLNDVLGLVKSRIRKELNI